MVVRLDHIPLACRKPDSSREKWSPYKKCQPSYTYFVSLLFTTWRPVVDLQVHEFVGKYILCTAVPTWRIKRKHTRYYGYSISTSDNPGIQRISIVTYLLAVALSLVSVACVVLRTGAVWGESFEDVVLVWDKLGDWLLPFITSSVSTRKEM